MASGVTLVCVRPNRLVSTMGSTILPLSRFLLSLILCCYGSEAMVLIRFSCVEVPRSPPLCLVASPFRPIPFFTEQWSFSSAHLIWAVWHRNFLLGPCSWCPFSSLDSVICHLRFHTAFSFSPYPS